jgi:hypothetical protein
MNGVTTGHGVSGRFAATLETLVDAVRVHTGDQGWHIHMQAIRTPQYSLRVYAPDRHSQLHELTMTVNTARDIREILANEAKSWQLRVQAKFMAADDTDDTLEEKVSMESGVKAL